MRDNPLSRLIYNLFHRETRYHPADDERVQEAAKITARIDRLAAYQRDETENPIWSLLADRPSPTRRSEEFR